ncbi:MAG: hypothetical protein K6E51_02850 [Treponema sp.]|nr:hypothetical protein [Treponema sp.]
MADYCKLNALDPSFIHFQHVRMGDREGIFDTDFSVKKEADSWHLSVERVQSDTLNLYFHFDDLYIKSDFFDTYAKEEFIKLVNYCSFDISRNLKIPTSLSKLLRKTGKTTEWKGYSASEIESKEYFLRATSSGCCFTYDMLPLVNAICQKLQVDLIREVDVCHFLCLQKRLGFVQTDDGFFVYQTDSHDHIDIYGKFDENNLLVCLAFLLDKQTYIQENKLSDSVLKTKRHFDSEREAKKYLNDEQPYSRQYN